MRNPDGAGARFTCAPPAAHPRKERRRDRRGLGLSPADRRTIWLWAVHTKFGDSWMAEILPGTARRHRLAAGDSE